MITQTHIEKLIRRECRVAGGRREASEDFKRRLQLHFLLGGVNMTIAARANRETRD